MSDERSDELLYRGFTIRAETYQLQAGGWTFEGVIVESANPHPRHLRFYLGGTTTTRPAAVEIIQAEGRRLVDLRLKPRDDPAARRDTP